MVRVRRIDVTIPDESMFEAVSQTGMEELLEYLHRRAAFCMFALCDAERLGAAGPLHSFGAWRAPGGRVSGVVLRFRDSLNVHFDDPATVAAHCVNPGSVIDLNGVRWINGTESCVDAFTSAIDVRRVGRERFQLAVCDRSEASGADRAVEIASTDGEVREVVRLMQSTPEFSAVPDAGTVVSEVRSGMRRIAFLREGDVVVSCATALARCSRGAMIAGVVTVHASRGRGLASSCVRRLTLDVVADRQVAVLYYPADTRTTLYERIGFNVVSPWTSMEVGR